MKGQDIVIQVHGQERKVGTIRDNTFLTRKDKDHYVRKYNGFGIALQVWEQEIRPDCSTVKVIYDREDGTQDLYTASVKTWDQYGTVDQLGQFEEQIFLSTSNMEKLG